MSIRLTTLLLFTALALPAVAATKRGGPPQRRKPRGIFCSSPGNCLSYEQIEALRRSLRDQDRSSRGRADPSRFYW